MDFQDHSKKESVVSFLRKIREENTGITILFILDNFKLHHSGLVMNVANMLGCKTHIPSSNSPELDPFNFIWKRVKRIVSMILIKSGGDLKNTIRKGVMKLSDVRTFAKGWNMKFPNNKP